MQSVYLVLELLMILNLLSDDKAMQLWLSMYEKITDICINYFLKIPHSLTTCKTDFVLR